MAWLEVKNLIFGPITHCATSRNVEHHDGIAFYLLGLHCFAQCSQSHPCSRIYIYALRSQKEFRGSLYLLVCGVEEIAIGRF